MLHSSGWQVRQLTPRSHELQYTTPFPQSQCTGGYLCGTEFQQHGCYASPDYSSCSYDSAAGESYCTICICYGSDSECDSSSGQAGTTPQPEIFPAAASMTSFSFKSFVCLLLFCVWFNALGSFYCFWYLFLFFLFAVSLSHWFQISHVLSRSFSLFVFRWNFIVPASVVLYNFGFQGFSFESWFLSRGTRLDAYFS